MEEKKETFTYTYSAKDQDEIRRIREKYSPTENKESPMERLRRLDRDASKAASAVSLIVGIIGTLVMGVGMCCTMVWGDTLFIPGIVIGIAGIACVIAAYPIYDRMPKRKRNRLAPEIIRLTDELMK